VHSCSQGHYCRLALRDIGTFLRYMESEFNVKVRYLVDLIDSLSLKIMQLALKENLLSPSEL